MRNETVLRVRGKQVRISLGSLASEKIQPFGFQDGQEVEVELGPDLLRISPRNPEGSTIRQEAGQIASELRHLRERAAALRKRLPEVTDGMTELAEPYTTEAELAVALEGAVLDLGPWIERLEEAMAATPERLREDWERARRPLPAGDLPPETAPLTLDLERFSEAARRAIYEDVVRSRFRSGPSSPAPDDFEIQVVYFYGRWMVLYRKLWEIPPPGSDVPRELLVVGLNERREPTYLAV